MNIDEAAIYAAEAFLLEAELDDMTSWEIAEAVIKAYLAALPSAEPGRDRIAVVVNAYGGGTADVMSADPSLFDWEQLEAAASEFEIEGPFAHNVVACRLRYYEPAEPVEVEGSVEGVGP